jgi:hypothetical protein
MSPEHPARLPSPPVAEGVVIRPERDADHHVIAEVVRAAFVRHPEEVASFVERIRASEQFIPELALVAEDSSGVIAHVMLSWVGVEGGSRTRILNLTPMSVGIQPRPGRSDRLSGGVRRSRVLAIKPPAGRTSCHSTRVRPSPPQPKPLSPCLTTRNGAFMEPRGCNRWQPVAGRRFESVGGLAPSRAGERRAPVRAADTHARSAERSCPARLGRARCPGTWGSSRSRPRAARPSGARWRRQDTASSTSPPSCS